MNAKKTIYITGGTGFLGKRLELALLESGYDVKIFTRSPKKPNHVSYDLPQSELMKMINGSYSVINLAGAPIIGKRWTNEYKKELYNSRIDTTKRFADIISLCEDPPKVFISASAIGYYNDHGEEWIDEGTKAGDSFISKLCDDWEQAAEVAEEKQMFLSQGLELYLKKALELFSRWSYLLNYLLVVQSDLVNSI
jgi:Predicted nucleoside-diphosphate sugar epimerase